MSGRGESGKNQIRCRKCGRLLMKGRIQAVEVKCPKCGYVQFFTEVKDISEN